MSDLNDKEKPDERTDDGPGDHPSGGDPKPPPEPRQITIQIDRDEYPVPWVLLKDGKLTGAEIRRLANPDIGRDRDLFEVVPGGSDLKIDNDDSVEIRDGMRFFSAPATINPGSRFTGPPTDRLVPLVGARLRASRRKS